MPNGALQRNNFFREILCALSASATGSSRLRRLWTIFSPTAEIKHCSGIKATGKHYASSATIEKQGSGYKRERY